LAEPAAPADARPAETSAPPGPPPPLAVVVKGWPRLSETFIAQELAALEARGHAFEIWSLRAPTPGPRHAIHQRVQARLRYLPEYVHADPLRVLSGVAKASALPGFGRALRMWLRDLRRDVSINRIRRFAQACVMAAEAPRQMRAIYVHFLHTPGSVTRYVAEMRGVPWGFSAHARDIWTIPDWEKREKIAGARFGVTCTRVGAAHLRTLAPEPGRVALVYHGLDLRRFPAPPAGRKPRDGGDAGDPLRIVSVGRLVEKKGYDVLIDALADLPRAMHWRFAHIGGGPLQKALQAQAAELGLAPFCAWRGPATQAEVIRTLRWGDIFVLPSRIAADGDRDGLPNVLMEAASQNLCVVAGAIPGVAEFVKDGETGLLVRPGDPFKLSDALLRLARAPGERAALGRAARARLVREFGAEAGVAEISARLEALLARDDGR